MSGERAGRRRTSTHGRTSATPGGWRPARPTGCKSRRLYRQADLSRPDPHVARDGGSRLPASRRVIAVPLGIACGLSRAVNGAHQSADADLQAGLAARLAADRHHGRLGALCRRHRMPCRSPGDLGDHGDALLAVADADQHRARRRLDRQGSGQCRQGAAAVDLDDDPQAGAAVGAAADLHRAAPVARRGLDGADRGRDAGAEPGPRQVRLGRVPERLVAARSPASWWRCSPSASSASCSTASCYALQSAFTFSANR